MTLGGLLLAGFAGATISHGLDGASGLFGFGKLFRGAAIVVRVVDGTPVERAEIVGGFEAAFPSLTVHEAGCAGIGLSEPEVGALRLVEPLLAYCGALKNPRVLNLKGGFVKGFEVGWDTVDMLNRAVKVF